MNQILALTIPKPAYPDDLYCAECGLWTEIEWDGYDEPETNYSEWNAKSTCCGAGFLNRFMGHSWPVEPDPNDHEPWDADWYDEPVEDWN